MLEAARALVRSAVLRRVETLGRDAAFIRSRLAGQRTPSFSHRGAPRGHETLAAQRGIQLRRARVAAIHRETPDAVSIELVAEDGRPFEHQPGQFLTLQLAVDGRPTRRAYSIAWSSDDQRRVLIGVKRVSGGQISTRLVDATRIGDELEVLGPSGAFTPAPDVTDALLVAGGSGITPLRRIAEALLARSPSARVALVFANRSASDVMFASSLAELLARHPDRFAVVHVHDVPSQRGDATPGPLDEGSLVRALDALPFSMAADAPAFLCGPDGLMRLARNVLERRGIRPDAIFEERFASPAADVGSGPPSGDAERPSPITFRRKDGSVVVLSPRPGATVLEAGLEANLPLGYSCAMGGCGACRIRLVSGEVSMMSRNCLDADEQAAGHILACVATARTPLVVEVGK